MAEKPIKSHDGFFKKIFSKKEEVKEFLEKTTPPEIVKNLQLNTLQLDPTNYVDNKLKEYFADVVYNCDYTFNSDETKQVKITFLFEHKSYKENIPHLQLGKYLFQVWDKQVEQQTDRKVKPRKIRLSPIIPIVFYHGTEAWNKQPFENYFEGMDNFLLQFLPKFDYHLIDMEDYDNFKIKQLFGKWQLQTSLLLMKNIFSENSLLEVLTDIYANPIDLSNKEQLRKFFENVSSYIYNLSDKNLLTKIMELMEKLRTQQSKNFISIAEHLEMKGELKGRMDGIENEKKRTAFIMIKKNYSDNIIMDITGLNILQIKYLKTLDEFYLETEA